MKKTYFTIVALFCLAILAGTSCQKQDSGANDQSSDAVTALVEKAGAAWDVQEVYSDESARTVYMRNCGIPADFLVDPACVDEEQQGNTGGNPDRQFIRDKSFIHCLRGLSLNETQITDVKQGLRLYNACSEHAIDRARAIYRELKAKYETRFQRLLNAFENGTITPEEFRQKVAELRTDFRAELRRMHLQEKLDDALAACLGTFFRTLHGTLNERQWNAFVECYRGE